MKLRAAAAVVAVMFGVTAPVSSAMAFNPFEKSTAPSDVTVTGSLGVHDHPEHTDELGRRRQCQPAELPGQAIRPDLRWDALLSVDAAR